MQMDWFPKSFASYSHGSEPEPAYVPLCDIAVSGSVLAETDRRR
jgi:hypothetical protein